MSKKPDLMLARSVAEGLIKLAADRAAIAAHCPDIEVSAALSQILRESGLDLQRSLAAWGGEAP